MVHNRCTLWRSPTTSYHIESLHAKQHLQQGSDNDIAAARTNPTVPPGMQRGLGRGTARRPSGRKDGTRMRHHVDAKQADMDSSLPSK
jgi:hypothetical protein